MVAIHHTKAIPWDQTLEDYLSKVGGMETDVLREMRVLASEHPQGDMQITADQGRLLFFLLRLIKAKRVLELGVFYGYGSLVMALALPDDGIVIACDNDPRVYKRAAPYWRKAGVEHKIDFQGSPACDLLNTLIEKGEGELDCVFIDADKGGYKEYYEKSVSLTRSGGLIILDNMLWRGLVTKPECLHEEPQASLAKLTNLIKNDERVDMYLMPLADGMLLARKR